MSIESWPHMGLVWAPIGVLLLMWLSGLRYIPHNKVGVIEKLWSFSGSLLGGRLIATAGEAGFQARILRGGIPIERLFDQLRLRRLAEEQKRTFAKQEEAAVQLKELNDAQAAAARQTELTQTRVDVEIAGNRGEAQLAEARRIARRDVARALGECRSRELLGKGEAARIAQVGLSEAGVLLQKVRAFGDPRLFALNLVADRFAQSSQPIVPERLLVMGGNGDGTISAAGFSNVLSQLAALLLAEKAGMGIAADPEALAELEKAVHAAARAAAERSVASSGLGSAVSDAALDEEIDRV